MQLEVSNLYISLKCNYLVYVSRNHSLNTEQFYPIFKRLTLWHVTKCIPSLKWLCLEFINWYKTPYYSMGDNTPNPLCV